MTTTSKPKPNLEASLAKARQATQSVKAAQNNLDAHKSDYRTIPLTPSYEINSKNVVRSKKNGVVITKKKGTNKYYLLNKKGDRKLYTLEELKTSLPPVAVAMTSKNDTAPRDKKPKKKAAIISLHDVGKSYAEIVAETGIKYNTVYMTIKVETARRIIDAGKGIAGVAEKLGISHERAEAFLERSGLI